jgi:hypothetical protein
MMICVEERSDQKRYSAVWWLNSKPVDVSLSSPWLRVSRTSLYTNDSALPNLELTRKCGQLKKRNWNHRSHHGSSTQTKQTEAIQQRVREAVRLVTKVA